jgi:hypothetical protein
VERTLPTTQRSIAGIGLALIAVVVGGALILSGLSSFSDWGALPVGLVLLLISLPVLGRQSRRESDPKLFWLLLLALLFKLVGAVIRHYVAFNVYGGVADATGYHGAGVRLAENFRHGNFHTGLTSLSGTNFIELLTGAVYTIIGPTRLGGFLFFSWLGFWGLFLSYRAFTLAVPEGRNRSYARLVFLLPSMMFWPSSVGKEAWMIFSIGIAAYGAARVLTGRTIRGVLIAAIGMWFAALVRPHVAAMIGVALVAGYLLRRPRAESRQLAPIFKGVALGGLAVIAVLLVVRTDRFLQHSGVPTASGVTSLLESTAERTALGGSQFAPSILDRPQRAPVAVATVLFRPHVLEATTPQTLATGIETTFLLLLSVARIPWLFSALRSVRRQPYVGLVVAYVGMFVVAFSGFANFGLLARQRVQVLPFYLVLLSIPPREMRDASQPDSV